MSRTFIALLVPLLLLQAACGQTDDAGPSSAPATDGAGADPAFPTDIVADNGDVTIDERPERIVSLSPTATEILFAVGAGDQVAAVDDQSNFPRRRR